MILEESAGILSQDLSTDLNVCGRLLNAVRTMHTLLMFINAISEALKLRLHLVLTAATFQR